MVHAGFFWILTPGSWIVDGRGRRSKRRESRLQNPGARMVHAVVSSGFWLLAPGFLMAGEEEVSDVNPESRIREPEWSKQWFLLDSDSWLLDS
jgi:hypothetical protein